MQIHRVLTKSWILNANSQSFDKRLDELKVVMEQQGVHLAVITETWWNEMKRKQEDTEDEFNGYKLLRKDHVGKDGGVVCDSKMGHQALHLGGTV